MLQFLARMSIWEPKKPRSDQWAFWVAAEEAIREVAAEALAAHFSRVFTCFCGGGGYPRRGRGSPGTTLFLRFHVFLWPRRLSENWSGSALFSCLYVFLWPRGLSEKWPRKP